MVGDRFVDSSGKKRRVKSEPAELDSDPVSPRGLAESAPSTDGEARPAPDLFEAARAEVPAPEEEQAEDDTADLESVLEDDLPLSRFALEQKFPCGNAFTAPTRHRTTLNP